MRQLVGFFGTSFARNRERGRSFGDLRILSVCVCVCVGGGDFRDKGPRARASVIGFSGYLAKLFANTGHAGTLRYFSPGGNATFPNGRGATGSGDITYGRLRSRPALCASARRAGQCAPSRDRRLAFRRCRTLSLLREYKSTFLGYGVFVSPRGVSRALIGAPFVHVCVSW